MKYLLSLLLIFSALPMCGQNNRQSKKYSVSSMQSTASSKQQKTNLSKTENKANTEILPNDAVEQPATFPGGELALLSSIAENLEYPKIAYEQEMQGTVLLRFKIDESGAVSDVRVQKSLSKECDAAAIAAVKKLPRFTPAKNQGKPVAVWFNLPVRFRIQN